MGPRANLQILRGRGRADGCGVGFLTAGDRASNKVFPDRLCFRPLRARTSRET